MDNIPIPPAPKTDPDAGEAGPTDDGEYVTISRAELEALRSRAESTDRSPEPAPRVREAEAVRRPDARDQRLAELERSCKAAVRERELATALAGRPLVAGAAAQLVRLWRDDFDVYEEDGSYKVSSKDGRAVAQVVGDWLASAEYSHFCLPTSRGGTGAKDANRPAGGSATTSTPKTLGEAIVMKWREEAAAQPNNLLKPIGLRRDR